MVAVNNIVTDIFESADFKAFERFTYRTAPEKIAKALGETFRECGTYKAAHWLYITQRWNPRAIMRTLTQIQKQIRNRVALVQNPAALFTFAIRFRRVRKRIRKNVVAVDDIKSSVNHELPTLETKGTPYSLQLVPKTDNPRHVVAVDDRPVVKKEKNYFVTYKQLTPIERYYFTIASRGAEEAYYRRLCARNLK